jgi:hypothetical protein
MQSSIQHYNIDLAWQFHHDPVEDPDPWRYADRPRTITQLDKLLPARESQCSTIYPFELLAEYVMRTTSTQRASMVAVCKYKGFRYMQLIGGRSYAERDGAVWCRDV